MTHQLQVRLGCDAECISDNNVNNIVYLNVSIVNFL